MVILGLDPGIARTGFGVINTEQDNLFVRAGCLTTTKDHALADRLLTIGQDLEELLSTTKPSCAIVETILFGSNTTTAMLTAQTRGVLLYILRQHHIPVHSLTPLQIKSRLTGYGHAKKHQIQHVVTKRLNLDSPPQPDDAADALAAALCMADESMVNTQPFLTPTNA